eukprot:scaffold3328_cov247-Prasinococcus_capsulatus_cf.AAC.4
MTSGTLGAGCIAVAEARDRSNSGPCKARRERQYERAPARAWDADAALVSGGKHTLNALRPLLD